MRGLEAVPVGDRYSRFMSTRSLARAGLVWWAVLNLPLSALAAELFAGRIDAGRVAALQVGGPDATGGIGDWALSNGTLCAVVSDVTHEDNAGLGGGVLIDLGLCGRGDDLLGFTQSGQPPERSTAAVPYLNLSGASSDPRSVAMAPGRYRVFATRGPEYSVT